MIYKHSRDQMLNLILTIRRHLKAKVVLQLERVYVFIPTSEKLIVANNSITKSSSKIRKLRRKPNRLMRSKKLLLYTVFLIRRFQGKLQEHCNLYRCIF